MHGWWTQQSQPLHDAAKPSPSTNASTDSSLNPKPNGTAAAECKANQSDLTPHVWFLTLILPLTPRCLGDLYAVVDPNLNPNP